MLLSYVEKNEIMAVTVVFGFNPSLPPTLLITFLVNSNFQNISYHALNTNPQVSAKFFQILGKYDTFSKFLWFKKTRFTIFANAI